MRKLLALFISFIFLALPVTDLAQSMPFPGGNHWGSGHSPSPLQSCGVIDTGSPGVPQSCTLTGVGPNHLLIIVGWAYNNFGVSPFTDTFGLTWTQGIQCFVFRGGPLDDSLSYAWAYTGSHTGSDTLQVQALSFAGIVAMEFDTGHSSGGPDADHCASGSNSSGTNTISNGNLTTTHSNTILMAFGETGVATTGIGSLAAQTSPAWTTAFPFFTSTPTPNLGILTSTILQAAPATVDAEQLQTVSSTANVWILVGTAFQF